MIDGVHAIIYTPQADEVRAFVRDILGWPGVDAGAGWPIFAMPPAELAIHPAEAWRHELYLLCDDLEAIIAVLAGKGVSLAEPVAERDWGRLTAIALPGGGRLGLYQPYHPRPVHGPGSA